MNNDFLKTMQSFMGGDFESFKNSLNEPCFRGIYVNRLKADPENVLPFLPFACRPVPFAQGGYYIDGGAKHLGTLPLHHAGAFYVQEPSAMSAVSALNPQKGEKVLDLCAAPGGKSINIASRMQSVGLLWSNEYNRKRAGALLSNIERMGIRNCIASNLSVQQTAAALPDFFDRVLVDAPCSGEGMFRREKADCSEWSESNVKICAQKQQEILRFAKKTLKPGGRLVYSTCTFNKTENEDTVGRFLAENDDFELIDVEENFGREAYGMPKARRILPMDGGEGHFVAAMQKKVGNTGDSSVKYKPFPASPAPKKFYDFWRDNFSCDIFGKPCCINGKVYLMPIKTPDVSVPFVRAGVLAGSMRGDMFFPHHQLYATMPFAYCKNAVNFTNDSTDVYKFLHGEETDAPGIKGFCAVAVEGIVIGFGKASGGKLKNHYPKGLRNLK